MKNFISLQTILKSLVLCTILAMTGCAEFNDPYGYGGGGYSPPPPYYGGGYGDPYYRERERERARHERHELDRERDRVAAERDRLEEARRRQEAAQYRPPAPSQDRCPPGFSPSEQKCSPDERRRGCKDIRLPSGLGCVRR